jgi:hypothetical protein
MNRARLARRVRTSAVLFLDQGGDLLALSFATPMASPSRNAPVAVTSRESWPAFPASATVVVISNALIAFVGDHHSFIPGELPLAVRARLFLFLMTGPFGGWAMASHLPHPSVAQALVSASAATLCVLLIRRFTRSAAALVGAAMAWVFCGYFVCIGVWI